ncbi:MAG: endo-1,3-alpha-glucanase family glycosylhydrolase [Planctomycetota bacterium]|nr:endo-1,3-alpha-glucanase family glycosylhydrolase [Planctomycetota bacterium]
MRHLCITLNRTDIPPMSARIKTQHARQIRTSSLSIGAPHRHHRRPGCQPGSFLTGNQPIPRLAGKLAACGLGVLLALLPLLIHAEESEAPQSSTPGRQVFAHYMVCFHSSVEFYKQEIELAQRYGIDGFALNCGQWKETNYEKAGERIYQAAKELGTGFKLFFSPDLNGLRDLPNNIGDMVNRFYEHPNQFRWDGRAVLSGWAGRADTYAESVNRLKGEGRKVCFVPFVYDPKYASIWSAEKVMRHFQGQPHMDGIFHFGGDGSVQNALNNNAIGRRVTLGLGKIFMAGLAAAYNSANLRDMKGMHGYGAIWEGIIQDSADWVEIVTWNDYVEDSNLMPFRWPAGQEKDYYVRDESFLDVTGYYSAWFKSGIAPQISQDKLYYAYRNRSLWQRQAWDEKDNKWIDITASKWAFDQIHDDVEDNIYVTTFLTQPAELTVSIGKKKWKFQQFAGVSHARVPLMPGVPHFALTRKKDTLFEIDGRKEVIEKPTKENSKQGYHLSNRTWTGGAAAGQPLHIEAESGELQGDARIESEGKIKGVQISEKDGSGFSLPVKALSTATYNIRLTYSNPSSREARLTLISDGPPRAEKEVPYYTPLFLPPTSKGEFKTASFFWSLYENTSFLKIEWQLGRSWGGKPHPEFDDRGPALIDAIELVKVEPVIPPAKRNLRQPEMVSIPGGVFTMGSTAKEGGNPDEGPQHKVTLSPFRLGRYEITNEEYEQFDPDHRNFRDGFSWRDREPVIYVSWRDAVKYCNWLSQQAGLQPAYDEKTWIQDMTANGYRLPTEAEWEFVATGRGEGRQYPWGNEAPTPAHGNFKLEAAIAATADIPSNETGGTKVVGACPAGASRDGVMDMAGNVSEWCSDTFQPYTATARENPCNQEPSNYRVIRGGSWGYYNYSQRSRDREYNNPGYPGYVYLGFRTALPQAKP